LIYPFKKSTITSETDLPSDFAFAIALAHSWSLTLTDLTFLPAIYNTTHSLIEPQHQPRNSALGASMPTHHRLLAICQAKIMPIAIATARTRLPRFVII
jgi:hypothetical protein